VLAENTPRGFVACLELPFDVVAASASTALSAVHP
jgi:hypothetical protein